MEDIIESKILLVEDLEKLKLDNAPRISNQRNDNNRGLQELDDILKVLSFLDETSCLDKLPRYVTYDYKKMPTARLEAGDMFLFLTKIDRLHDILNSVHKSVQTIENNTKANVSLANKVNELLRIIEAETKHSGDKHNDK